MSISRTHRWQEANERFHLLMRATPEIERHLVALRALMVEDAGVSQWTNLTARRIEAWCAWLEDYDTNTRAQRVERRLCAEARRRA